MAPAYLDFDSTVSHHFVERNESPLQYRLVFDKHRVVHITLPAPAFFDYQARGGYTITREETDEYERRKGSIWLTRGGVNRQLTIFSFSLTI